MGTTGYLALLKRALCPSCPYVSLDPGAYRRKRRTKFTCNVAALEYAGLRSEVRRQSPRANRAAPTDPGARFGAPRTTRFKELHSWTTTELAALCVPQVAFVDEPSPAIARATSHSDRPHRPPCVSCTVHH